MFSSLTHLPTADLDSLRGHVMFVGAGPGDPSLLTMAAVTALNSADVVLANSAHLLDLVQQQPAVKLAPETLVTDLSASTEGLVPSSQARATLVRQAALGGRKVVRLVPGDPFLDGGAIAEAAALARTGMNFEVIPGVSSLTAIPEYAGVALSENSEVHYVVALDEDFFSHEDRHWGELPTIIVQTRAGFLRQLSDLAQKAGRSAREAVLVIFAGGTTEQLTQLTDVTMMGRLNTINPEAEVHIVIGQAVSESSDDLDWFESKPLFGWRILVPQTKTSVNPMVDRLRSYGARVEEVPTISVEQPRNPGQIDKAIRGLVEGRYEWVVFTSCHAVRAVRERFNDYGLDARSFSGLKVAAVNPFIAGSLQAWGIDPDLVGEPDSSLVEVAEDFPEYEPGYNPINRVFLPRADVATETFAQALTELGWEVEEIVAYRTVRAAPPPVETREAIKQGQFDAVVFSSSSAVRNLVGIAGKPHAVSVVAAIGPATSDTCTEHSLRVDVVADNPSGLALADALADFASHRRADMIAHGEPVVRPSQKRRRRRAKAAA